MKHVPDWIICWDWLHKPASHPMWLRFKDCKDVNQQEKQNKVIENVGNPAIPAQLDVITQVFTILNWQKVKQILFY